MNPTGCSKDSIREVRLMRRVQRKDSR
jgi:hypothetical protein